MKPERTRKAVAIRETVIGINNKDKQPFLSSSASS